MQPIAVSQPRIVYFSSASENTRRFVDKLDIPARRIPLRLSLIHI